MEGLIALWVVDLVGGTHSERGGVCRGISTTFKKPYFPPNDVQPTDKNHLQVRS